MASKKKDINKASVTSFLKSSRKTTTCATCRNKPIADVCAQFLKLRKRKKVERWQSWRWFCMSYVNGELGIKISYATMMNHVRGCLGWRPEHD